MAKIKIDINIKALINYDEASFNIFFTEATESFSYSDNTLDGFISREEIIEGNLSPVLFNGNPRSDIKFTFQEQQAREDPSPKNEALNPLSLEEMRDLFGTQSTFEDLENFQHLSTAYGPHVLNSFPDQSIGYKFLTPNVALFSTSILLNEENPENLSLYGEEGNDSLYGADGNDNLYGAAGADLLSGGSGNDTLYASVDAIWSGNYVAHNVETGEVVSLNGKTSSHDVFKGGDGYDTLQTGDTGDALFLDDSFAPFYDGNAQARIIDIEEINAGGGDDIIDLTSDQYSLGDITLKGGDGNDTLWSSNGNDFLYGDDGNDSLYGGEGDDFLDGGLGADRLDGGGGNDTFIFDINDISVKGGSGLDTVQISDGNFDFSSLNALLDNIEILDLENTTLTVDSTFLDNVNGQGYTMQVDGNNTSQITFEETFVDGGTTNINGQNYTVYTNNDTTIHVESNVTVVMP